jgi:hypothetical protein
MGHHITTVYLWNTLWITVVWSEYTFFVHSQLPLWLAKTSYTRKMNDMATGSIRTVPIKCLS